jgi:hypothetical protein
VALSIKKLRVFLANFEKTNSHMNVYNLLGKMISSFSSASDNGCCIKITNNVYEKMIEI